MRKITKFLMAGLMLLTCAVGLSNTRGEVKEAEAAQPATLYLTPNSNWKADKARFAAYFFGNGEKWVSMSVVEDETDLYSVAVPSGYPSVIFCRMNPSNTANSWNTRWNQTANLTIPTDGTNHYTVKEGTWDKGGGTWSTYTPVVIPEEPEYNDIPTGMNLYLDSGVWELAGAWFAVEFSNGDTKDATKSIKMEKYNAGIYKCEVPSGGWKQFRFLRMNPETNEIDTSDDTKMWNSSNTLSYDGSNDLYYVDDWNSDGKWSKWDSYIYNPTELGLKYEGLTNGKVTSAVKFTSALPAGTDASKNASSEYNVGFRFDFHKYEEQRTVTKLFLSPNANWKADNARFAAYFFDNGETWVSMTDSNKDGIYEVTIPTDKSYPKVIFCRMNPGASANNWDNKWNQTANLTIPTDGTNHYTVKEGTWDKGGGTWSTNEAGFDIRNVIKDTKTGYYTCANIEAEINVDYPIETCFAVTVTDIPAEYTEVIVTPAYQSSDETLTATERTILCNSFTLKLTHSETGITVSQ